MMRHVNVINGLDANAMTPERVRQALLGAIRFGKPFAFDMMGSDLYETLDKIFEEIHPGLMKMVLDKSINKDDNFMKLVREDDSEEYQQSFQYDIHKERFEFIVLNNKEGPTGFSDKMMTVNIVHD
ncbi:hypothetical protein FSP39_022116 [Pinctada imbricata]|uniref:Uncharacterized protein n=1 Tax=Pinctada imbricata TaxID=66713 RepID=A0AA89BQL1_PINIB|nr:hypothetical protein FSP39_022116 [Pinctada imbricata]